MSDTVLMHWFYARVSARGPSVGGIEASPRVPCALHKVAARGAWSAFHGLPKN